MLGKRAAGLLTALTVAAMAAAMSAGPSSADSESTDPAADPELAALDQVHEISEPLSRLYDAPGFGKVVLDTGARTVEVWWHGTPPKEVTEALGVQANGVTVVLREAVLSDAELNRDAQRLMDRNRAAGEAIVDYMLKSPDLSGLTAIVEPGHLRSARSARRAARDGETLEEAFSVRAGVPVDVVAGQGLDLQSRGNDSAPWQGGAQIRFPGTTHGNICTTGFSVLENGTGRGLLLTAGHCTLNLPESEANAVSAVNDWAGDHIANDADTSWAPNYESLIIDPDASPATIGQVYGGPWNATSGNARYDLHVGGSAPPAVGDIVCVSGANGGERCNRTITNTSVPFNCPGTTDNCSGFIYSGSGVTSINGDSGAPVYVKRSDGRVGARGIHIGGLDTVSCPSDRRFNPQGDCSSQALAVGIHQLESRWGVTVEED
jgi:V8-like Glu-specific endopeptidase